MPTLMIFGAGRNQLPAYRVARKMGLQIVALDPAQTSLAFDWADHHYVVDLADEQRCLEIARQHAIDGAFTLAADYPVRTIATICKLLRLSGLSPETAYRSTSKRAMRDALRAARVPIPCSTLVSSVAAAVNAVRQCSNAGVVKPSLSQGGQGITVLNVGAPESDVADAFWRAQSASRDDEVLVEEYVGGQEYSVETLTFAGVTAVVAFTEKLTTGPPYCVEIGHFLPAPLVPSIEHQLSDVATATVDALGIDNSPAHVEVKVTADGPVVIEAGARLGGGFIASHLVPLATGVDLVRAAINVALGRRPETDRTHKRGAAIRFLSASPEFVPMSDCLETAQDAEGVIEVDWYSQRHPSDLVLRDATGRLGHVICTGPDVETARENAERAICMVRHHSIGKPRGMNHAEI